VRLGAENIYIFKTPAAKHNGWLSQHSCRLPGDHKNLKTATLIFSVVQLVHVRFAGLFHCFVIKRKWNLAAGRKSVGDR